MSEARGVRITGVSLGLVLYGDLETVGWAFVVEIEPEL